MTNVIESTNKKGQTANDLWKTLAAAENGSPEFQLALMESEILRRLDNAREQFVNKARWIADNMTSIANQVESDPTRRPNSLGELQSNASELNALCGSINALRTALFGLMG